MDKVILDACCGGRMFWFNKHDPEALYVDIREESPGCCPQRPLFEVKPDMLADFRNLPFSDGKFKLIIFDPPHLRGAGKNSIMGRKYGTLGPEWKTDFKQGFVELWRVLAPEGTLIFKWNTNDIPLKTVLACFSQKPRFGHPTSKHGQTIWCVFFKSPAPSSGP